MILVRTYGTYQIYIYILNEVQNGFRPGRACIDHIFSLSNIIHGRLLGNRSTFVSFIDLKKAYDPVDRKILWRKLEKIGIPNQMVSMIKNLYNQVSCTVKTNDTISEFFAVDYGVRQGCILSPLLFIFINDIIVYLNNEKGISVGGEIINCLMYADDLAVLAENDHLLQDLLQGIGEWCQMNHLEINEAKSAVIHFRKRSSVITEFNFHINNNKIMVQPTYKYLGVIFDEYFDFCSLFDHNLNRDKHAFFGIRSIWYRRGEIRSVIFKRLVKTYISLYM